MNGYVKKVSHTLILGLIIFLVCYIFIFFMNEKVTLPNGTLMSKNRFNGQISIKLPNDEFTHFQKDNPFYEEISSTFNSY